MMTMMMMIIIIGDVVSRVILDSNFRNFDFLKPD